jgi:hypothetical protein
MSPTPQTRSLNVEFGHVAPRRGMSLHSSPFPSYRSFSASFCISTLRPPNTARWNSAHSDTWGKSHKCGHAMWSTSSTDAFGWLPGFSRLVIRDPAAFVRRPILGYVFNVFLDEIFDFFRGWEASPVRCISHVIVLYKRQNVPIRNFFFFPPNVNHDFRAFRSFLEDFFWGDISKVLGRNFENKNLRNLGVHLLYSAQATNCPKGWCCASYWARHWLCFWIT